MHGDEKHPDNPPIESRDEEFSPEDKRLMFKGAVEAIASMTKIFGWFVENWSKVYHNRDPGPNPVPADFAERIYPLMLQEMPNLMIESAKYPLESSKHGTYKRIADEYARGLRTIAK